MVLSSVPFEVQATLPPLSSLARALATKSVSMMVVPLSPALKLLTQHEVAAIEFAGREVAGEADSAAPLHRYLEQCML